MRLLAIIVTVVALVGCVTVVTAPEGKVNRCGSLPQFVKGKEPTLTLPEEDPEGLTTDQLQALVLQLGMHAREWRTYSDNERLGYEALVTQHYRDCH